MAATANTSLDLNGTLNDGVRHDWSVAEIEAIYNLPFPELLFRAQTAHRAHFNPHEVQRSTLLSIKTGGCSEDCKYCPQSVHNDTGLERHSFLPKDEVLQKAREAKADGSTRFCMGAAWRQVKDGMDFDHILDLVRGVAELDTVRKFEKSIGFCYPQING